MATQTETVSASRPVNTTQVRIQLSTQSPDIELPEATGPILVSTDLRRIQLSTLVNRLLATDKPTPFEFLVNGTFLRSSLDDFLTEHGISSETTLQVEYVRAQIPPQQVASFQHDDWVSSIDVLSSTSPAGSLPDASFDSPLLLSSSYDGLLRTWSSAGQLISTSPLTHTGPVKSAKFLSPSLIASSGLDRTVRLWTYSLSASTFTPFLDLYAHTGPVDRLAVCPSAGKLLAASSDHLLSLYNNITNPSTLPPCPPALLPSPPTKRRRTDPATTSTTATPTAGPTTLLRSHAGPVTDLSFDPHDPTVAYSVSHDRTLKTWDLTTSRCADTRPTSHPLLSLHPLLRLGLVATGSAARHIALVDPRQAADRVVAATLRGHANAVVSLDGMPGSEYGLVSAAHDGAVRGWDVRMAAGTGEGAGAAAGVGALWTLRREGVEGRKVVGGDGVKVFGVRWDAEWGLVSAGEDKRVQIHRVPS